MKGLARSYIWWSKLDSKIEQKVRDCTICQSHRNSSPVKHIYNNRKPNIIFLLI